MESALLTRWNSFTAQHHIPAPSAIWDALIHLYTEPHRHYHNLHHIQDCLNKLDAWPSPTPSRHCIELALWFHDAIQDTHRCDNEDASAGLLRHFLPDHPLAEEAAPLILATHHKESTGMSPEEIICDIDLSILGSPPSVYLNYARNIRREYHYVLPDEYIAKRTAVLQNFLDRCSIYHTSHASNLWQAQARINLSHEIAHISSWVLETNFEASTPPH